MKRRRFLQAMGSIAAIVSAPVIGFARAAASGADAALWGAIDKARGLARAGRDDMYLVVMHPQQIHDLRCLEARERWYDAWRAYRVARSLGIAPEVLGASTVLDIYTKVPAELTAERLYFRGVRWTENQLADLRERRAERLTINKILGL